MNFELIDNSFQIIILGLSTIAALFLALRYKSRSLLILALAYACFCMGTTYYILYLVIMGKVPQVFYVAEISWLFLLFLQSNHIHHHVPDDVRTSRLRILP